MIPIAPGYLGKYKGEKLDFILKASNATKRSIDEKQFIAQNDSSNDHIYDDLRESIELSKGSHNPGKQWLDIFFFEQKLKETGQKFFFDTSRIDLEALQSSTKNDILQNNEEYIKSIEGEKDQVKSLTREEYLQRLFPAGGASEDVTYNYEYLMRLNMRKVIEDDFGIEISALPLSSQVQFLKYINGRTVDEVKEMQDALSNCKDYKIDVAKAFLACTEDEKTYSQAIIKLAEKLDPDIAKQLFGKYAEIASAVDGVREYLNETFQSEKKPDEKLVNQAAQNLLHRGNELLKSFADKVDANADISSLLEKLDTVKAEAMLFTSTFKALHQNQDFRILDLRELALAQFDVLDAPDLKKQKAEVIAEEDRKITQQIKEVKNTVFSLKDKLKSNECQSSNVEI